MAGTKPVSTANVVDTPDVWTPPPGERAPRFTAEVEAERAPSREHAATLAALQREREGYLVRGIKARVAEVDEAIAALTGATPAPKERSRRAPRRTG